MIIESLEHGEPILSEEPLKSDEVERNGIRYKNRLYILDKLEIARIQNIFWLALNDKLTPDDY